MEKQVTMGAQPMGPSAAATHFLKLPLAIDLQGLLQDLAHCNAATWQPHYNSKDYDGGWDAIALRSTDGQPGTVVANPENRFQDTWLLGECPHFQAVLNAIDCEKESVRLLRQAPGGRIKTHCDHGLHYQDGVVRLHIPLVTNDQVDFVIAGERVPMQPGECWFGDFSQPHSVDNGGETERIHMVVDCIRSSWTDQWFADAGFVPGALPKRAMALQEQWEMVAALAALEQSVAKQIYLEKKAALEEAFLGRLLGFLDEIGIVLRYGTIVDETFLPGILVDAGSIVIDRERLLYVGDVLHEAGHIALLPNGRRADFSGNMRESLPEYADDELAVILWTYAAALHLGLPLEMVIHDDGYKGEARFLRDQFQEGTFIGLPLLVWMGFCTDPKGAPEAGFPKMLKWLRD